MRIRCVCRCHHYDLLTPYGYTGVSVDDVVEAAIACDSCINHHCPALLHTELPAEGGHVVSRGTMQVITPEGKHMTFAEYEAEMERRADAWRHSDPEAPTC